MSKQRNPKDPVSVRCNNCEWKGIDASDLEIIGEGEDSFRACPKCRTDDFLQDIFVDDLPFLERLKHELETQDNLCTSDPAYIVYEYRSQLVPDMSDVCDGVSDKEWAGLGVPGTMLTHAWVDDCCEEVDAGLGAALQRYADEDGDEDVIRDVNGTYKFLSEITEEEMDEIDDYESFGVGEFERMTRLWHRSFVACFFTQRAADQYIEENRHNLTRARVFVESFNRCHEMVELRKLLISGTLLPRTAAHG